MQGVETYDFEVVAGQVWPENYALQDAALKFLMAKHRQDVDVLHYNYMRKIRNKKVYVITDTGNIVVEQFSPLTLFTPNDL